MGLHVEEMLGQCTLYKSSPLSNKLNMMADKAKITSAEENGKDIAKISLFISTMSCVFKQQVCHDRAFVNLIQGSIGSNNRQYQTSGST